jgi:MoxR-like ATPase
LDSPILNRQKIMLTNQSVIEASASLRAVISATTKGLVEREALVEMVALSAVAEEHVLVIGPPGTAKSEAVRRIARATGGRYFEYLLGRFTEPSEIFGPVDLHKLKDGSVETDTLGMLPEADIAFLDEIFQGSTAILNTLLGILNERVFRRGHTNMKCPLRVCVGASNSLPEDAALAAFADRFLVRCFVDPIPDPMLEQLLESGWSLNQSPGPVTAGLNDIEVLTVAARKADMSGVRHLIAHALRTLRGAGITLTDRRAVRAQKLIAVAALMAGRDKPTEAGSLAAHLCSAHTRRAESRSRQSARSVIRY